MKQLITIILASFLSVSECCAQFNTIGLSSKHKIIENKTSSTVLSKEAENIREKVDVTAVEKVDTPSYICVAYPLKEVSVGSGFGMRKHPITHKNCMHNGIDLRARYEAVFSMLPGTVVSVGEDARSGKYVTVQTACYTISYCHLYKQYVANGDWVMAGQVIAQSGNTGWSTGPHLHLTTKKDGKAFNPTILLEFVKSVKEQNNNTD